MAAYDSSQRERCNEKVRQLMNRQFSTSIDHRRFCHENEDILDYELYKVVRDRNTDVDTFVDELEKVCTQNQFHVSIIFNHVAPAGDSLLHVSAEFWKPEVVELIAQHFPVLLNKRNRKGDSPLHVAARANNIEAMNVILSKWQFVTSENNYGNTALHEAVLSKHLEGVNNVLLSDEHTPTDQQAPIGLGTPSMVVNHQCADLLKRIVNMIEELRYQRDEKGNTPLHHDAANAGYVEGVGIMFRKSKNRFSTKPRAIF
ncbi:uncharacterized protein LOC129289122 [Prosopis cineraria]|uniref:uncharacterized protein LOC129289122 n=1 Tax=Prosopis cineraria TaxID=364024 RepID=UPI00240FE6EF|nr:uncharacterized protein LOC129289122 [Prosopis cineraria]